MKDYIALATCIFPDMAFLLADSAQVIFSH